MGPSAELGKVVVGDSTGGNLATISANQKAKADALILARLNFGSQPKSAELSLLPRGSTLLPRLNPSRSWKPTSPEQGTHWTTAYALESQVQMVLVVKESRNQDYRQLVLHVLVTRSNAEEVVDQAAI
jgi:hypothetical protein